MGLKGFAATLMLALSAGAANAQVIDADLGGPGDAVHGKALFQNRCGVCHVADKGGKNGLGPALYGAYGRRAGTAPGFAYSLGLKAATFAWTPEKLNQWIQKPASLVPGVRMTLAAIRVAQDRADIIAYLTTVSDAKK
jgi:cytochrome c